MRLAAFQMVAKAGDVAANLAMIAEAAAEAKAARRRHPGRAGARHDRLRRRRRDPRARRAGRRARRSRGLREIAAEHGIAIVAGFAERAGERIYNSAALVDAGRRAAPSTANASSTATTSARFSRPATPPPAVVEFGGMKLGLLICYDVEFPEAVRASGGRRRRAHPRADRAARQRRRGLHRREDRAGARLRERDRDRLCRPRRRATTRFAYAGRSCIAMPDGKDAARAPAHGSALIVADYDPANFAASRLANPYLRDRRSDLFQLAGDNC